MKKLLFILSMLFVTSVPLIAQEDTDEPAGNEKIRDKMNEFIQKRLQLSKEESNKFSPVFLQYFKEWRQTLRENRGDKLILQQKIVELRLRYRTQFREVLGEHRGNQVFRHQDVFIQGLKDLRNDRLRNNPARPPRRPVNNL
ncbi:MAG: hypothetical protein H7Y42_12880 [Chitinophagaceae bacterium]|nr:hypothetical protein [Chitinophagaceae bacterium]